MNNLAVVLFAIWASTSVLLAQGTPISLEQASKQMSTKPVTATTPAFIDQVFEQIRAETCPKIKEEIAFLINVENYEIDQKAELTRTQALLTILNNKYKDDPDALMQLYLHEISLYRNIAPDAQKLAEVVAQLTQLSQQVQNGQAITYLTQLIEIGDSYRALPGGYKPGELQDKARACYMQVLNFPLFNPVYEPSIEKLRDLYVQAALDLVSITSGREMANLEFIPFSWGAIANAFPEKAKLFKHVLPGMDDRKKKTEAWLKNALQGIDKDSEIYPHIVAVLEYINTREY